MSLWSSCIARRRSRQQTFPPTWYPKVEEDEKDGLSELLLNPTPLDTWEDTLRWSVIRHYPFRLEILLESLVSTASLRLQHHSSQGFCFVFRATFAPGRGGLECPLPLHGPQDTRALT